MQHRFLDRRPSLTQPQHQPREEGASATTSVVRERGKRAPVRVRKESAPAKSAHFALAHAGATLPGPPILGQGKEAGDAYEQMQVSGVEPGAPCERYEHLDGANSAILELEPALDSQARNREGRLGGHYEGPAPPAAAPLYARIACDP